MGRRGGRPRSEAQVSIYHRGESARAWHKSPLLPIQPCGAKFESYPNLQYHISLHSQNYEEKDKVLTFGQSLVGRKLCKSLVMDCMEQALEKTLHQKKNY